ncbi:unnamed protein product [Trichogramma brassicae]|uniref:Uncharacterized protein n=1 Tax=Trichogramma brassicae TaxID=86971 RepID=A0A6H5IHE8_9HYME|nr:unnamed protein product [Trichogramma brassicae]
MFLRPMKYIPIPVEQIGMRRVKFSTNRSFSPNSLVEMEWQFCRSQRDSFSICLAPTRLHREFHNAVRRVLVCARVCTCVSKTRRLVNCAREREPPYIFRLNARENYFYTLRVEKTKSSVISHQLQQQQQSIRHQNFWTTHCRRAAINQRPERDALPNAMTQVILPQLKSTVTVKNWRIRAIVHKVLIHYHLDTRPMVFYNFLHLKCKTFTPLPFYSRASFAVFLFGKRVSARMKELRKIAYGASQCFSKRRRLDLVTYVTAYWARVYSYCLSRDPLSCLSRAARRATYLDVLARHLRRLDDKKIGLRDSRPWFCKLPRLLPLLLPPLLALATGKRDIYIIYKLTNNSKKEKYKPRTSRDPSSHFSRDLCVDTRCALSVHKLIQVYYSTELPQAREAAAASTATRHGFTSRAVEGARPSERVDEGTFLKILRPHRSILMKNSFQDHAATPALLTSIRARACKRVPLPKNQPCTCEVTRDVNKVSRAHSIYCRAKADTKRKRNQLHNWIVFSFNFVRTCTKKERDLANIDSAMNTWCALKMIADYDRDKDRTSKIRCSRSPDSGLYVLQHMHRSDLVGLQLHAARRPSTRRGATSLHPRSGVDAAVCNVRTDVTTECTAASPRASSAAMQRIGSSFYTYNCATARGSCDCSSGTIRDRLRNIFRLDAKRISFDRTSKILAVIKSNKSRRRRRRRDETRAALYRLHIAGGGEESSSHAFESSKIVNTYRAAIVLRAHITQWNEKKKL